MTRKTHYPISGDVDSEVQFAFTDQRGNFQKQATQVSFFNEIGRYPTHLATCSHPEGKVWESIFIPYSASGDGISITWWAKNSVVNGSFNIKKTNEYEWYCTLHSKAVLKGYTINHLTGVEVPFSGKHQFIRELPTDRRIPTLCLTTDEVSAFKSPELIAEAISKGLLAYGPTQQFVKKFLHKGHASKAKSDPILDDGTVATHIIRTLLASGSSVYAAEPRAKPKETAAPAAERYGSVWGAFG